MAELKNLFDLVRAKIGRSPKENDDVIGQITAPPLKERFVTGLMSSIVWEPRHFGSVTPDQVDERLILRFRSGHTQRDECFSVINLARLLRNF